MVSERLRKRMWRRPMYGGKQRVLSRHCLGQGLSTADVAGQLGISRRTLYYWNEAGQLDRALDNAPVGYLPSRAGRALISAASVCGGFGREAVIRDDSVGPPLRADSCLPVDRLESPLRGHSQSVR